MKPVYELQLNGAPVGRVRGFSRALFMANRLAMHHRPPQGGHPVIAEITVRYCNEIIYRTERRGTR